MAENKWRQEIIYVKRDKNGVIIAMEEEKPEGFVEEHITIITEKEGSENDEEHQSDGIRSPSDSN